MNLCTALIRPGSRWLWQVALVCALFPGALMAQTRDRPPDRPAELVTVEALVGWQPAPQPASGLSRAQWTVIGSAIGAGAGALFGASFCFAGDSNPPHAADVWLGAGIGAASGALIARVLARNKRHGQRSAVPIYVAPVITRSRTAVVVTIATK